MGLFRPVEDEKKEGGTMSLLKWLLLLAIVGIVASIVVNALLN